MAWSASDESMALFERLDAFSGQARALADAHHHAPRLADEEPGSGRSMAAVLAWLIEGREEEGSVPPMEARPAYPPAEAIADGRTLAVARHPYGLDFPTDVLEKARRTVWPLAFLRSPLEVARGPMAQRYMALFMLRRGRSAGAAEGAVAGLRTVLWMALPFALLAPLGVQAGAVAALFGLVPFWLGQHSLARQFRVAEAHIRVNREILVALYHLGRLDVAEVMAAAPHGPAAGEAATA